MPNSSASRTAVRILPALALLAFASALFGPVDSARAASCTATVEDVDFASVDTLAGTPTDTASRIAIGCDGISPQASELLVCIHLGSGGAPTRGGDRTLAGSDAGGERLAYRLFADPARQIPWGSVEEPALGSPRSVLLAVHDGSASGDLVLYARALGGQRTLRAGPYSNAFSGIDTFMTFQEGRDGDCNRREGSVEAMVFQVRARVDENCLISTQDIHFGQHGLLTKPIDALGGIELSCTPGADFSVAVNGGLSGSSDPTRRLMRSGPNTLVYGLFLDEARSRPFGATESSLAHGTGTGAGILIPVYGRVLPQSIAPGIYSDVVGVTVTYGFPK